MTPASGTPARDWPGAVRSFPKAVQSGFHKLGDFTMLPVLVVLVLALSLVADKMLTPTNLANVLSQSTIVGAAAIGATFVILTGGIDLSVGSTIGASGLAAAWTMLRTDNILLGLVAGVAIGVVAGLAHGLLVGRAGLAPFAVTLVGLFVISGVAMVLSEGVTVAPTPSVLTSWNFSFIGGVPAPVWFVAILFVVAQLVLSRTGWGRRVILIGANPRAAEVSGVNVKAMLLSIYAVAGAFSAIAGFLMTANLAGANADMGAPQLLNVVGAVALGGTSLFGGRGSVTRTAIGALVLGFLANGMNLIGLASYDQQIVTGAAIAVAVGVDALIHRQRR